MPVDNFLFGSCIALWTYYPQKGFTFLKLELKCIRKPRKMLLLHITLGQAAFENPQK